MTLLATSKAWSLGSPLRLDLVFVLILVEGATLFEHFIELPIGDSPRGPLKQQGKPHLKPSKSQG
jgi:hypothetical protein